MRVIHIVKAYIWSMATMATILLRILHYLLPNRMHGYMGVPYLSVRDRMFQNFALEALEALSR